MSSKISPEQFAHDVVMALIASGRTSSSNVTASGLLFDLSHLETSVGAVVQLEKLIADAYRNAPEPKRPMKISPELLSRA
jgi:hypothetical protein